MKPGPDTLAVLLPGSRPISPPLRKVYAYADETGQDTEGRLFVVSVVLVGSDHRDALESRFLNLEARIRGQRRKWHQTRTAQRQAIVAELDGLRGKGASFAWSERTDAMPLPAFTAKTVADAASVCCPEAELTAIVDGLKEAERREVTAALRGRGVRFRKVCVNCRDESYPLLRLADAVAGFLRDVHEGAPYTADVWREVKGIFIKV